jgi:hypothetical protein
MRQAFIDGNAKDVALTLVRELIHGTSDAIKVTAAKYGINLA